MRKQQLAKLKRLQAAAYKAQTELAQYKEDLSSNCDHPEDYRSTYPWSHSNGYGRWTTEQMPFCGICRKVQYNSAYNHRWGPIPVNNYDD